RELGLGAGFHGHWLRFFSHCHLPVAPFADAGAEDSALAAFFDDKRRSALGTRLDNRLIGRGEIAFRIAIAAIEDPLAPACKALGNFALAALRAGDAQRLRADVLALRVGRAADEFSETAMALQQLCAAIGTLLVDGLVGRA